MSTAQKSFQQDIRLAQACLAREPAACDDFERTYRDPLCKILSARGASPVEADDLVRDFLSDCVMGRPGGSGLLGQYHGRCSLKSWLAICATRRFIDGRIHGRKKGELPETPDEGRTDRFEAVPAPSSSRSESGLITLLRGSLEYALALCPAKARLMLKLVYIEGLTQREIGTMWQYHESKVSRQLDRAMQAIAANTLAKVKEQDPFLVLEWTDFLKLCESSLAGLAW